MCENYSYLRIAYFLVDMWYLIFILLYLSGIWSAIFFYSSRFPYYFTQKSFCFPFLFSFLASLLLHISYTPNDNIVFNYAIKFWITLLKILMELFTLMGRFPPSVLVFSFVHYTDILGAIITFRVCLMINWVVHTNDLILQFQWRIGTYKCRKYTCLILP